MRHQQLQHAGIRRLALLVDFRVQHQGEFAAQPVGIRRQPCGQFCCGKGVYFFELFGQLAPDGDRPRAPRRQCLRQRGDAVRCFQQHHRAGLLLQRLQRSGAFCGFRWQKSGENKAGCGAVVDPGGAQQCGHAADSGQRDCAKSLRAQMRNQPRTRVADPGRSRVADVGHPLALAQTDSHFLRGLHFVVLVHSQELRGRFVDAVGTQQRLGVARVFAGHGIGQLQQMQSTQGDVGQIADGRGQHVQAALRIMLGTGGRLRGVQGRAVAVV